MKYHHKEIIEIEPIQNIAFNRLIELLVWNDDMEEPRKMSLVAVIPRFDRPFLSSTQEYFQHAGQIDGVKTNWDVFAERYGLEKDFEKLGGSIPNSALFCDFCPALKYCTECKTSDCRQNFADWAYSDAPEKDQGV